MSIEAITDSKIKELIELPKIVENPNVKWRQKSGHRERNYYLADCNRQYNFTLYLRQNLQRNVDFSCGLAWYMPSGEILTLVRYNGSSHIHTNKLENGKIEFKCHIHYATERYIKECNKVDGYAVEATQYSDLTGALRCLIKECNISEFIEKSYQKELFYEAESIARIDL